jgi:hypothetical protein
MNGFLKIGTILCWAVAIGSEYVAQKWPQRKKLLNVFAACMFALALSGEYVSYRYDSAKEAEIAAAIDAQGIPETKWFMAKDAEQQDFEIPDAPLEGKVDVLINGLMEPGDVYSLHGRILTVATKMNHTDQVIVRYRRHR